MQNAKNMLTACHGQTNMQHFQYAKNMQKLCKKCVNMQFMRTMAPICKICTRDFADVAGAAL